MTEKARTRTPWLVTTLAAVSLLPLAAATPGGSQGVPEATLSGPDYDMEVWIRGLNPPCDPVTFCQTCIATTIATCLGEGGSQASGLCEVDDERCRCAFECKKLIPL